MKKTREILNRLEIIIDKVDTKEYLNYLELSNDLTSLYNDISIEEWLNKKNKKEVKNESKN